MQVSPISIFVFLYPVKYLFSYNHFSKTVPENQNLLFQNTLMQMIQLPEACNLATYEC
jgi:hypothetical protein